MSYTAANAQAEREQWDRDLWREYVRDSGFKPYMGKEKTSMPIVLKEQGQAAGKLIHISLITRLKQAANDGTTPLVGNEEAVDNYTHGILVALKRHATVMKEFDEHISAIDLRNEFKPLLKEWSMNEMRDDIIAAMQAVGQISTTGSGSGFGNLRYSAATTAQLNTWRSNNLDRILYGSAKANSATDHATSLGNVDSTNDKLTASVGMLAKRMAKTADPRIRPIRTGNQGREYFVMFCNPLSFRDLKNDSVMTAANREARPRDVESNPIFQDGDLIHDGVIYREIPEIGVLTGVGAGGIDVAPNFLCGAQALGIAWGKRPRTTKKKEDDYENEMGVGITEIRGVEKMFYNDTQHGMVTVFTSGVAD